MDFFSKSTGDNRKRRHPDDFESAVAQALENVIVDLDGYVVGSCALRAFLDSLDSAPPQGLARAVARLDTWSPGDLDILITAMPKMRAANLLSVHGFPEIVPALRKILERALKSQHVEDVEVEAPRTSEYDYHRMCAGSFLSVLSFRLSRGLESVRIDFLVAYQLYSGRDHDPLFSSEIARILTMQKIRAPITPEEALLEYQRVVDCPFNALAYRLDAILDKQFVVPAAHFGAIICGRARLEPGRMSDERIAKYRARGLDIEVAVPESAQPAK